MAVKDLSEKSRPNMSLWSCWEFKVRSGRFHSLYSRHTPFLLNTYIIWALFPDAVGAGGNGLISDPPKNCILPNCQINDNAKSDLRKNSTLESLQQAHNPKICHFLTLYYIYFLKGEESIYLN